MNVEGSLPIKDLNPFTNDKGSLPGKDLNLFKFLWGTKEKKLMAKQSWISRVQRSVFEELVVAPAKIEWGAVGDEHTSYQDSDVQNVMSIASLCSSSGRVWLMVYPREM
jgi:hypothetical protein